MNEQSNLGDLLSRVSGRGPLYFQIIWLGAPSSDQFKANYIKCAPANRPLERAKRAGSDDGEHAEGL